MASTGNDKVLPKAARKPEILKRLLSLMKLKADKFRRVSSSLRFTLGGIAGSSAPLLWSASRASAGKIGLRNAGGVGLPGNCGVGWKRSVSLAQVSNVEFGPPALVLTWMNSCQAS